MKKFLIAAAAVLSLGAQGVLAEQAADAPGKQMGMAKGSGLSAVQKAERPLHQRHRAERAELRKQHMAQKPANEQVSKDWQDLNVRHHQERRAMAEKHADQASVDKGKLLKDVDDMEQSHAAARKDLADKLNKDGVSGKPRYRQFEKLQAKQRQERHQLYRKHFGTAK